MRPGRGLEGAWIQPDFLVNIILLIGRIVNRNLRLPDVFLWKSTWSSYGLGALLVGVLPAGAGGVRQPVAELGSKSLKTLGCAMHSCEPLRAVLRFLESCQSRSPGKASRELIWEGTSLRGASFGAVMGGSLCRGDDFVFSRSGTSGPGMAPAWVCLICAWVMA
jgi:hypothetical protein